MRSTILLVALAGLVAALVLLFAVKGGERSAGEPLVSAEQSSSRAGGSPADRGPASAEPRRAGPPTPTKTSAERERMRGKILAALQARAAAGSGADQVGAEEDADVAGRHRAERRPDDDGDTPPTPGDLKDRSGNHGYLLKVMNEELMPLADECYTLARHDNPELAGLLVLDIDIIGDEEIGGVIEAVRPGEANQIVDPILLECMRESLFATTLPQPEESGRDGISLSMPLGPEDPSGDS